MDRPGSTPRSSARRWLPVALLGPALGATVAAMPAPAQAADVQVRVLVDVADLFPRIEIVSEKDPPTYARVLAEFGIDATQFVMVGNSLRSDIEPVVRLGGWGVHMPYPLTWAHEAEHGLAQAHPRVLAVEQAAQLPGAVHRIVERARNGG